MKRAKLMGNVIGLLVVTPIWYYLLYKILRAVNASELMMFLFWVYFPAGLLLRVLTELGTSEK